MVLTLEDIKRIHEVNCERFGGDASVRDNDLLSCLCEQPYQEVFGEKLYPTVYDKAAKLLESFAHHQVFVDGNKRTGFMSMVVYLGANNIQFKMSQLDAFRFVMDVVAGKYSTNREIADVIQENSEWITKE